MTAREIRARLEKEALHNVAIRLEILANDARPEDEVAAALWDFAQGYASLRASIVRDALFDRQNTGDNTPAVVHVRLVPGDRVDVKIAAKGGGSELGTRLSADQRMRVEQGTRAYLESLARTMMNATSKKTQELGEELMRQLAKPDGVDYRLVKQKFDSEGKPQTPDVGHFDIGDPPNAAETHRNAAAIADSNFHGERRWLLRNKQKHLTAAADELERALAELRDQEVDARLAIAAAYIEQGEAVYVSGSESAITESLRDFTEALRRANALAANGSQGGCADHRVFFMGIVSDRRISQDIIFFSCQYACQGY